jgi:hypothetical protein
LATLWMISFWCSKRPKKQLCARVHPSLDCTCETKSEPPALDGDGNEQQDRKWNRLTRGTECNNSMEMK